MSFFFSSRRRHTRCLSDWSSDVCSSDLAGAARVRRGARPLSGPADSAESADVSVAAPAAAATPKRRFRLKRLLVGALAIRSEEHTSELQSLRHLVCRLLLEKKKHNRQKC